MVVAEVPVAVTVTDTGPAEWDGVVKVSAVPDRVKGRKVPPNVTVIVDVNPVPSRVTVVPPPSGPAVGEIEKYRPRGSAERGFEQRSGGLLIRRDNRSDLGRKAARTRQRETRTVRRHECKLWGTAEQTLDQKHPQGAERSRIDCRDHGQIVVGHDADAGGRAFASAAFALPARQTEYRLETERPVDALARWRLTGDDAAGLPGEGGGQARQATGGWYSSSR